MRLARIVQVARIADLRVILDPKLRNGFRRKLADDGRRQADPRAVQALARRHLNLAPTARAQQDIHHPGGRRHERVSDHELMARIHPAEVAVGPVAEEGGNNVLLPRFGNAREERIVFAPGPIHARVEAVVVRDALAAQREVVGIRDGVPGGVGKRIQIGHLQAHRIQPAGRNDVARKGIANAAGAAGVGARGERIVDRGHAAVGVARGREIPLPFRGGRHVGQ